MLHTIKPLFFALLLAGLLAGCVAPAPTAPELAPTSTPPPPTATESVPTSTPPPPTQALPTKTPIPVMPGVPVDIPVNTETFTGAFPATITGSGNVGIILANTESNNPLAWLPLVDALDSNENLRMVTFAFRDVHGTSFPDTRAVFDYLRAEGVDKMICMGGYYGAGACAALQTEPELIGMVFFPSPIVPAMEANFTKLFLTADVDASGYAGALKRAYEQAAEPKLFKSYASGRSGLGLFTDPDMGSQVLADVTDFIDEVVSGQ